MKKYSAIIFIALITICISCNNIGQKNGLSNKVESDAVVEVDDFEVASCSNDYLNNLLKSMNDINEKDITVYLESFNYDCETFPEYQKLNNEVLFKIISKYPDEVVEIMDEQRQNLNIEKILNEIKNPLKEKTNVKKILKKIKETDFESKARKEIINALKAAKDK